MLIIIIYIYIFLLISSNLKLFFYWTERRNVILLFCSRLYVSILNFTLYTTIWITQIKALPIWYSRKCSMIWASCTLPECVIHVYRSTQQYGFYKIFKNGCVECDARFRISEFLRVPRFIRPGEKDVLLLCTYSEGHNSRGRLYGTCTYRRVIGEKINLTAFNVGFELFIKARRKGEKNV